MWFNEKSYGDDVYVFYNCLLHAFKSMIQGFMPIRAYTTMQEDVGVRGIPESVFSKSVFWYCKVSLFPPNIDIVLFYGKYKDIDIDAQYQEIYLIYWYFQYFSVS